MICYASVTHESAVSACSLCAFSGDQRDVFSELSALRRHLRSEEKRLEGRLQQVDWEELDSPLSDRSDPAACLRSAYYMYHVSIEHTQTL